jgi:hypothetical protein
MTSSAFLDVEIESTEAFGLLPPALWLRSRPCVACNTYKQNHEKQNDAPLRRNRQLIGVKVRCEHKVPQYVAHHHHNSHGQQTAAYADHQLPLRRLVDFRHDEMRHRSQWQKHSNSQQYGRESVATDEGQSHRTGQFRQEPEPHTKIEKRGARKEQGPLFDEPLAITVFLLAETHHHQSESGNRQSS